MSEKTYPPFKLLGTYGSVDEMMEATGVSPEVRKRVAELREQTRLTLYLAVLRESAGITQAQMGNAMNTSQSYISKLEAGMDEGVTIGDLKGYARTIGRPITLTIGPFDTVAAPEMEQP